MPLNLVNVFSELEQEKVYLKQSLRKYQYDAGSVSIGNDESSVQEDLNSQLSRALYDIESLKVRHILEKANIH